MKAAGDENELAKRLAAAYVSWHLDISFQSAYKRYVEPRTIGAFWQQLATNVANQAVSVLEPKEPGCLTCGHQAMDHGKIVAQRWEEPNPCSKCNCSELVEAR